MGMLMARHRLQGDDSLEPAKPARKRNRKPKGEAPETPAPPASPYAELDDEQVLEAYATNVPEGEADTREAMQAELEALDAEDDTTGE